MEINRWMYHILEDQLQRPYVHILFGARQTGKTTLLNTLVKADLAYNLADPQERTRLLADNGIFRRECEALGISGRPAIVLVDEAQLVPSVFDAVQVLYDRNPDLFRFILCGSSARKLRQTGANLLPGRSLLHRLSPLMLQERPGPGTPNSVLFGDFSKNKNFAPSLPPKDDLVHRMAFGDLPGMLTAEQDIREDLLRSYTSIYLEEEIRREAYVKDWGAFVNFLKLAATESGQPINYAKISRETRLSEPTVKSHYQLLEDMFVGFHLPAHSNSSRKNLLSRSKFFFFDLGVRHAAAGLRPSIDTVAADPGRYFEQWVGLELHRRISYAGRGTLNYFGTRDGAEIDFILEHQGHFIPIEVKWTESPTHRDARHLIPFLKENPAKTSEGYVVCRCPRPAKLAENITAIPWWMM